MKAPVYVFATTKEWHARAFPRITQQIPGDWHLIEREEDLSLSRLQKLQPRFIFFPHWSGKVPPEITSRFECVCFHSSDVPYGRGGSPIQNLIARGHKQTQVSALRMTDELDAGPVYMKAPLSLAGRAQDIFEDSARIIAHLIERIIREEPSPQPQTGEVLMFKRRKPEESRLPEHQSLEQIYDHIRMLDADSYPHAFIEHGDYVLEFTHAEQDGQEIKAQVKIRKKT